MKHDDDEAAAARRKQDTRPRVGIDLAFYFVSCNFDLSITAKRKGDDNKTLSRDFRDTPKRFFLNAT